MFLQKEILQWLRTFGINQLKLILTIKNPANVAYIKKIMSYQPEYKPVDRISHGYSETKVQNEKSLYIRQKFRYKKKKEEKIAMDKVLIQNITVSREYPWSFSVKKQFIKSEQLKKCMLLFSDEQAFQYYEVKQVHVKLGGEKPPRSIWFETSQIHSLSEWLIYLFEMEIFEAYQSHKKDKTPPYSLNHFTFVEEHITQQYIKKCIDNLVTLYSEKRLTGKYAKKSSKRQGLYDLDPEEQDEGEGMLQVSLEQAPYIAARCLQRMEGGNRTLDEIIFEYEWYSEDRKSKVNIILKDLCKLIVRKYKDFEIDVKVKEIEALTQSKKKKKRSKKVKESQVQELEKKEHPNEDQNQKQLPATQEMSASKPKVEEETLHQSTNGDTQKIKLEEKYSTTEESKQPRQKKSSENKEQKSKDKAKKNGKPKAKPKPKKQNSLERLQAAERQQSFAKAKKVQGDRQKQEAKKVKRVVKQRINQHILFYYQQLCTSSQSIDKYRKICIQTIESTLQSMQLKVKWEMIVYGSYSIDFSLRDSDLDIVIVVDDPEAFTLHTLQQYLRVQQWLRQCNIIQIQSAKVDILEFEIILSCLKHPKLKDPKKLKDVIHVDISMTHNKTAHEGIRNTAIMQKIFSEYPSLKIVSLVLKELLRIYELNKPFKGGIGSYVLVILVHNIIKMTKLEMDDNYSQLLNEVCTFMTETFQPYKTLISPFKDTPIQANSKLELNIEDPEDKALLNTTKLRQINEIVQVFKQLKMLLTSMQTELQRVGVEERKKMKRIFFEQWNILFKPHEEMQLTEK